ncbi:MAG: hypothetical protein KBB14_10495 [Thermoanaerobaculia bacterium]|jgi:hypothetical protein|nr:hypothetical protein [Thermoanaerobaculia bacterium]
MSRPPLTTPPRSSRRGSALITVIIVVLVLTVVGLGVAYFASTEDRTSGNAKMSRAGFYAAEAGLRQAEALVTTFTTTLGNSPTALLTGTGTDLYSPPGGGRTAYLLKIGSDTYKDVVLDQTLGDDRTRPMYSLYVRNNQEDPGGDSTDTDARLNIIAVGQVVLVNASGKPILDGSGNPTIGITKVLEEQLDTNPTGSAAATQKGANTGGTSAGAK